MNWSDVGKDIAKAAPILGGLMTGPVGLAVTAAGALASSVLGVANTPDAVSQALATDPAAAVKLAQIESDQKVQLQGLLVQQTVAELAASTAAAQAVNATMQAEDSSSHWPSYSWRPAIGFAVAFNVVASSVLVLMVFVPVMFGSSSTGEAMSHLPAVLGSLAAINGTVLPILGIASYFRGKSQLASTVDTDQKG